jgi:dolichyl-phosphate beta-glucosyltransferase
MTKKSISVIVPCFNEEKTIHQNLKKIHNYLHQRFENFEIIAINDGSRDATVREIKRAQQEMPVQFVDNVLNEGKGKVICDGMLVAKYEIAMFLDADLGIPIEELEKFVEEISNGSDIVIASRFVPGLKIRRPVLWYRKLMEKAFRLMRVAIINQWNVKDTQCGFKVFRKEAALKIFPKVTVKRFAFDAEVIFIASKFRYKIKELPIALQNPPNSHVRLFLDPLNMTLDLIRIRINDLKGRYK